MMQDKFELKLLHPKYLLSWMGVLLLFVISLLPTVTRHKIALLISKFIYQRNHKRRNIIIANLRYCFPEFSDQTIIKLSKENMFYTVLGQIEYGVIIFANKKRLSKMLHIEQPEYLSQLSQDGVLLLAAHSPMLDLIAPALEGFADGEYHKAPKDRLANFLIFKARSRFMKVLLTRDNPIRDLLQSLNFGKKMYFPADEDLGDKNSVFVPFFSSIKATLTTPARISKITNCLCLPLIIVWDHKIKKYSVKHQKVFDNYPSGDDYQDALSINKALEDLIRPNIAQYMWSFKLFRTRPKGENSIYSTK